MPLRDPVPPYPMIDTLFCLSFWEPRELGLPPLPDRACCAIDWGVAADGADIMRELASCGVLVAVESRYIDCGPVASMFPPMLDRGICTSRLC